MKPSNLFNSDDRAVSPVIGVILMVAITVILAAVIGTFVLGLGDSLGDSQPTAQIDVSYDNVDTSNANVTIEHSGGDPIDSESLRVVVSDQNGNQVESTGEFTDRFTVGDISSGEFNTSGASSDTADLRLRIIHQPSDSILVDRTIEVSGINGVDDGTGITFN